MADAVMVIGDERLAFNLHSAERIVAEEMYRAALEASVWVEASARMHVPKRTGNLARSIFTDVKRFRSRVQLEVGVSDQAPYGVFVEHGTGIYGEYRRPFPVHRGNVVYMHQGMRPRPFIEPAVAENERVMAGLYEDAGRRIARRLSGDA